MKQLLYALLASILAVGSVSAQIVGGAGRCHVAGNPNTISALNVQIARNECTEVVDTTTWTNYRYDGTLPIGSRWVVISVGGDDWGAQAVVADARFTGNGTSGSPLQIALNSLDATHIAAGGVGSSEIADGSVLNADLGADAVTTGKILDGTILLSDLAFSPLVSVSALAPITGDGTSGSPLTVAPDGINATHIAAGGVGSSEILDGSVANADLAPNAVTTDKILDGTITLTDLSFAPLTAVSTSAPITGDGTSGSPIGIATDGINATHIAAGGVGSSEILDGSVANADLGANAVTTDKILDGTITLTDLSFVPLTTVATTAPITGDGTSGSPIGVAADGIDQTHIATGGVGSSEIADGSIVNADLAANAVNSTTIADGTVQAVDLAFPVVSTLSGVAPIVTSDDGFGNFAVEIGQSGATAGQALVWNGTAWIPSTVSTTAQNGLVTVSGAVEQGGTLLHNTAIDQATYNMEWTNTLPSGRTTEIHAGSDVINAGIQGVGFTTQESGMLGYLFTGDATSTGGAAYQTSIGLTNLSSESGSVEIIKNGAEIRIQSEAQGAGGTTSTYSDSGTGFGTSTNNTATGNYVQVIGSATGTPFVQTTLFDGINNHSFSITPSDITTNAYPNTRDDSGTSTPTNVLYTDVSGTIKTYPANIPQIRSDVDDTNTALGIPNGSTNMGTFTNTNIPDNTNLKTILESISPDGNGIYGGSGTVPSTTTATLTDQFTLETATSLFGGAVPFRVNVTTPDSDVEFMTLRNGADSLIVQKNNDNYQLFVTNSFDVVSNGDIRLDVAAGSSIMIPDYPNTRNDAGTPVNVLTTDAAGNVQSHSVSELGGGVTASNGVTVVSNDVQLDLNTLTTTAPSATDFLPFVDVSASNNEAKATVSDIVKTPGLFTDKSVIYAGSTGALTETNTDFNYDYTNDILNFRGRYDLRLSPTNSSIVIGETAGNTNLSSANMAIGKNALSSLQAGFSGQLAIGENALQSTTGNGAGTCFAIGYNAVKNNTFYYNMFGIGTGAAEFYNGGGNVLAIGNNAARGVAGSTTASGTLAIGHNALRSITTGSNNTGIGHGALTACTTGAYNVSVGSGTGETLTGASYTSYVGHNVGQFAQSGYNTVLGGDAYRWHSTGEVNTIVGVFAMGGTPTTTITGSSNCVFGYNVMSKPTTNANNVVIGAEAFREATTGNNNVLIGHNVARDYTSLNQKLLIESSTNPTGLLSGDFSTDRVGINTNFAGLTSTFNIEQTAGATQSILKLKNSVDSVRMYVSTATPEGSISADPGSVCFSEISGTGKLYLKKTGTGNTGWKDMATAGSQIVGYIESQTGATFDMDVSGIVKDFDGVNLTTITVPDNSEFLHVYKNGQMLSMSGALTTRDYSLNQATNEITFTVSLLSTDRIKLVRYAE